MTHATRPAEMTPISTPIPFQGGNIIGFLGLRPIVELPNGDIVQYWLFEEGFAERNAAAISTGHETRSGGYFAVGSLTLKHFPNTDLQAHKLVMTSNVPQFIATIQKKEVKDLTAADYESVAALYQNEYTNGLENDR
jgi:hypothetical protein